MVITGSAITGDVAVGQHSTGVIHTTSVTGAVDVADTATLRPRNGGPLDSFSGGVVHESLAQAQSDANSASTAYAALTPTQTFGNVTTSLTITGNGGTNVISMNSLDYSRKTLTLSGGPSDVFIFNVARDFTFNHSQIALTGGVTANHVIFNFTHAASSIDISNSSNVSGTFLAPHASLSLRNSPSVQGELIAKDLTINADQQLTAAGFALPVAAAPTGSLSGIVYIDFNFDGSFDSGDTAQSRVTVTLTGVDSNNQAVSLSTETASDGSFSFTGLAPGTYQLTVDFVGGANATNTVGTAGGTTDVGSDTISNIVLTSGAAGTGYNFGGQPAAA
jgi:hypothetical protein